MTFDELFSEHKITAYERRELVYFLAAFRMRKTIERLLPEEVKDKKDAIRATGGGK